MCCGTSSLCSVRHRWNVPKLITLYHLVKSGMLLHSFHLERWNVPWNKQAKSFHFLNILKYLKQKFIQQSEIKIGKYIINLNSRELILGNKNLKLTEKEVNIIIYLSKLNKPKKIEELQIKVWGYHSELDTHTVETHVYRSRKKIFNYFNDDNFIISKKNGYQIN